MTNTVMGPLPAVSGCACRICVLDGDAGDAGDDLTREIVETVVRSGWYVMAVGAGACECCEGSPENDDGPNFAYTIGLGHRAGHPELAMTGLPVTVMHRALNEVADRIVRDGLRVRPGDVLEAVLPNAPVTVEAVSLAGMSRTGIGSASSWFQRQPVEALQLVWPAAGGVFAWQPGAPAELDEQQPPTWRIASPRTGALAADPPWPFVASPVSLAIVCTHVRKENEPVRFVSRTEEPADDADDGELAAYAEEGDDDVWDVHCGCAYGRNRNQWQPEHLSHTVRAAPSLRAVADLRVGECAERADASSPWRRRFL